MQLSSYFLLKFPCRLSFDFASVNLTFNLFSVWVHPPDRQSYELLSGESVHMITTEEMSQKYVGVGFNLSGDIKWFEMKCVNAETSQWSYIIVGCTVNSHNMLLLSNVPLEKIKHWIIDKTSTYLKIVCNGVTVLNFNFGTDCDSDRRNGVEIWSRKALYFKTYHNFDNAPLLRVISRF